MTGEEINKEIDEAQKLVDSNNLKNAKVKLFRLKDKTVNKPLFHAGILLNIIDLLEKEKNFSSVINYSEEVLAYINNHLDIFLMIKKENIEFLGVVLIKQANAYLELKQIQNAIDAFNEVILLNTSIKKNIDKQGLLYAYQGIGGVQLSISQNIKDKDERTKLLRKARKNMKLSLQLDPSFFPTYSFLAIIYNNLGEIDKS